MHSLSNTPVALRGALLSWALIISVALPSSAPAADKASGAKSGGKLPKWSIPWLQGTTLSKRTIVEKRFGRLQRNEIWDDREGGDIQHLVTHILEKMDYAQSPWKEHATLVADLKSLHAYAHFYNARLMGRNLFFYPPTDEAKRQEGRDAILAEIEEAVKLGYTNHKELEGATELFPVQLDSRFTQLIKTLGEKAEQEMQKGYRQRVDQNFARYAKSDAAGAWKPALFTVDETPTPFWPQKAGPSAVVVCRIHHDGLEKFLDTLNKVSANFPGKVDFGIAFYQIFGDDPTRHRQSRQWRDELGIRLPCTVIDRAQFRELRSLLKGKFDDGQKKEIEATKAAGKKPKPAESYEIFQPVIVFLDAAGKPVFQTNGVLRDWQLHYVVEQFVAAVAPKNETPKPPTPAPQD
jgi:hypothetical protein